VRRSPPPFSSGVAAIEPASGDPLRFSPERPSGGRLRGPPSFVPERFCTARVPGSSPGTVGRLDLRRLSTSAIATVLEHDRGRDHHPARFAGSYPPAGVVLGSVASYEASLAELSRVQGPACALQRRRRLPAHEAREFYPSPIGPDTSCHEPVSPLGRRSRARIVWDRSPHEHAGGQRKAIRARAASPDFPRRRSGSAHPRCLPSMGSPEGLAQGLHRLSPTCGVTPSRRLYDRRDNPRR